MKAGQTESTKSEELESTERMSKELSDAFEAYDSGKLSRRQLVAIFTAVWAAGTSAAQGPDPTFKASGLNHIALNVTDVARSRDFYVRHLGLDVTSNTASSVFLDVGPHFLALFRSRQAGLAHYCYSVPDFELEEVASKLRGEGIAPRIRGRRIYFSDPDGLEVQLARG